jgi:hypothetical protein
MQSGGEGTEPGENAHEWSPFGCGLHYNGRDIDPGAQTERPGGLGPVRTLLGGMTSPAAFRSSLDQSCFKDERALPSKK